MAGNRPSHRPSHSMEAHVVGKRRVVAKYKKIDGDKWTINASHRHGSVRPIDLVSRNPDRLSEFESKEAAVAFEEECHQEAKKRKAAGEDWSQYRYIPRKQLTIQSKPLEESGKPRGNGS